MKVTMLSEHGLDKYFSLQFAETFNIEVIRYLCHKCETQDYLRYMNDVPASAPDYLQEVLETRLRRARAISATEDMNILPNSRRWAISRWLTDYVGEMFPDLDESSIEYETEYAIQFIALWTWLEDKELTDWERSVLKRPSELESEQSGEDRSVTFEVPRFLYIDGEK